MPLSEQALLCYARLFEWQSPLSLWKNSDFIISFLEEYDALPLHSSQIEHKKLLEGWIAGRTLTLAYPNEPCLTRLVQQSHFDAQLYRQHRVCTAEVTQAIFPGQRRNHFIHRPPISSPLSPLESSEQAAYRRYYSHYLTQVCTLTEERIAHKYHLYTSLDVLIVYLDLLDPHHPFGPRAYKQLLSADLPQLFAHIDACFESRWKNKIHTLCLLSDSEHAPFSLTTFCAATYAFAPLA